jgi:hypothetical protein
MDGVAAKIAKEVAVFLEQQRLDPGTCEEQARHHAGRSSTYDYQAFMGHP